MVDVFVSYRHADADDVLPLVRELRECKLEVWIDEDGVEDFASIQRSIELGLDKSKVLLAWYSARYPDSLACQWELSRAFLAGQAEGEPRRRVLVVNPESGNAHIHPIELRDALYRAASRDPDARRATAEAVSKHVRSLPGTFDQIVRPSRPRWIGSAVGDGSNRFVGRLPELWAIHSGLGAADVPIIESGERRPLVYLTGIAGTGKSLAAETYGLRFGAGYPGGIFWLRAFGHDVERQRTSEERAALLKSQLVDIALALGLQAGDLDTARLRASIGQHLNPTGPYLWVVDDFPSKAKQQELQPWLAPSALGRSLVTTRSGGASWAGRQVRLGELDEPSALALLGHRRAPETASEQEEARALVHDLGCHPLALELAAAAVQKRGFAAFRDSLRSPSRDVMDFAAQLLEAEGEELPHRRGADQNLSTTLLLSISALPESGKDILRLASQLAPIPIPRALVVQTLGLADSLDAPAAEDAADIAIATATAESLAREPAPGMFLVHSLVSRTIRFRDTADERRQSLRSGAIRIVDHSVVDDVLDLRLHARVADAMAHARVLLEPSFSQTERLGTFEGRLLDSLYIYSFLRGDFVEAGRAADRLIANATAVLGPTHEITLVFRGYAGRVLFQRGKLAEALAVQEELYELGRRVLGERHPATLRWLSDVGLSLHKLRKLERAAELQTNVLEVTADMAGEDHLDTATAMNNLASTLLDLGGAAAALPLQERVVDVRRRQLGADHPETLAALRNLAVIQRAAGVEGAQQAETQAAELGAEFLAEDHPDSLLALNNQAAAMASEGNLEGAKGVAERALAGRIRVLGADHPDTLTTENVLAAILSELGEYERARTLFEDALARSERVFGRESPDTVRTAFQLMFTLGRMRGDSARMRELNERYLSPVLHQDPENLSPELRAVLAQMAPRRRE